MIATLSFTLNFMFITLVWISLGDVVYENCSPKENSSRVNLFNFSVEPCNETPCVLYPNETSTFVIVYNTTQHIKPGNVSATTQINDLNYTIPLPSTLICNHTSPICPLNMTQGDYTFNYSLHVPTVLPRMNFTVKLMLDDDDGENYICVKMNVTIKDREEKKCSYC